MNFKLVENSYMDWNTIREEFTEDYLYSDISNNDLRRKYALTHREFKECSNFVKSEYGLKRRPFWKYRQGECKYYYKVKNGFIISKRINGEYIYFGFVPSLGVAEILVELCKNAAWNIQTCRQLIKSWELYV